MIELDLLLAGPILRRRERDRVFIWLATSEPCSVAAEIYDVEEGLRRVGGGAAISVRFGPRLFVHLIEANPDAGEFPHERLLGYDLSLLVDREDGLQRLALADLGLLDGPNSIAYEGLPLPTFFVRGDDRYLTVIHGSCRLLHGRGEDALMSADEFIEQTSADTEKRPSALYLTGDQIYADDVSAPVAAHLREMSTLLMGERDPRSIPGVENVAEFPVEGRKTVIREQAMFTSDRCSNHLMTFGEYAAMYLFAWNHENWPATLPDPNDEIPSTPRERLKIRRQTHWLEHARRALPAVRRVLANVPTYMIFDDHDVTDDWNLTREWHERVRASPTGRRVIANALAAFWAFQGWGNDPDGFDPSFIATIVAALEGDGPADDYDELMWSFDRWSYHAPTIPPTVFLDTRTHRAYDADRGAARLVSRDGLKRVVELARQAGHQPGDRLVVVSAVPVFGFELQERRQKYLFDQLGPYEIDFEAWHSNLRGLIDLMEALVEDLRPSYCVLLSGDVHFGVNARAGFEVDGRRVPIVQLVSSGQKHAGVVARTAMDLFGRVVKHRHERVGYEAPPEARSELLKRLIMKRPVNTDEWSGVSPVFLAPRDLKILGLSQEPDYRECRIYVRPEEPNSSVLVGENNVGVVSVERERVTHRLLARGRHGTRIRTASIDAPDRDVLD